MSAPDAIQRYGTIVVVGGGCYGSYYVRQLARARAASAVTWERLVVVDRDPACRVATDVGPGAEVAAAPPSLAIAEWTTWFDRYLAAAAADRESSARDAIVPSPLMPHLMFEWVVARARERWPLRRVERRALDRAPDTPWERASPDGTHYVSFATWMCPINCIEPRRCPHTGGPRDWSMPLAARRYVEEERAAGRTLAGPAIFHCVHRAYGVGMFDTSEVLAADDLVREVGERGAAEILIGTMSHCHGAFGRLSLGAAAGAAVSRA